MRTKSPESAGRGHSTAVIGDNGIIFIGLHSNYSVNSAYIVIGYNPNYAGTALIQSAPCTDHTVVSNAFWPVGQTLSDTHFGATVVGYGGTAPNQYLDVQVVIR